MQLIHSELSKEEYLASVKSSYSSPFDFFCERFTGFCIGNFFYVIHHCEHQWDRKYNTPKNAAIGHVVSTEGGCDILFLTFKGLFCPSQFLILSFLVLLMPLISSVLHPGTLVLYGLWQFWITYLIFIFLGAGIATLFESMTDRSTEGENALLSLLYNPQNPY